MWFAARRRAREVRHEREVVRRADRVAGRRREHREPRLGADLRRLALPERPVEGDVARDVRRRDRHVVDVAGAGSAGGEALRAILEVRLGLLRRRDVELGVPEDLVHVAAVRGVVAERAAVADRLVHPADREFGVDPLRDELRVLRSVRAPRDVFDPGLRTLGDDQARVQPLGPAAQVDRLPLARGLLEPEDVDHPVDRLLRLGRDQLDVRELGQEDFGHHALSSNPNQCSNSER